MIDVVFTIVCWGGGVVVAVFLLTVLFGAPFVPTHARYFKNMLQHLDLDFDRDVLVDLGAGDGRILKLVAPSVKSVVGYEINPFLWVIARINLARIPNAQIRLANFHTVNLPAETTIIYVFSAGNSKTAIVDLVHKHLKKYQLPITFVSYGFEFEEFGTANIYHGFYVYDLKSTSQKIKKSV